MKAALVIVAIALLGVAAAVQVAYLRSLQSSTGGGASRTVKVISFANIALLVLAAAGLVVAGLKTGVFGGK